MLMKFYYLYKKSPKRLRELKHIVESLSQTDSQALKRAELKGYLQKWKDASNPISLAIYLDVLSPLQ